MRQFERSVNFIKGNLIRHQQSCKIKVLAEENFKCTDCQKRFNNEDTLSSHRKNEHTINFTIFKCSDCEKAFLKRSSLTSHKHRKHVNENKECHICLKIMKSNMQRHIDSTHCP